MNQIAKDFMECVGWAAVILICVFIAKQAIPKPAPVIVEIEAECEPLDPSDLEERVAALEQQIEDALRPYRLQVAREHEGRKPEVRRIRRTE